VGTKAGLNTVLKEKSLSLPALETNLVTILTTCHQMKSVISLASVKATKVHCSSCDWLSVI